MNPSDETSLRYEIKRLRERLDATGERHAAELDAIRRSISEVEAKLSELADLGMPPTTMQRVKIPEARPSPVQSPPPLPKPPEPVEKSETVEKSEPTERLEIEEPKEELPVAPSSAVAAHGEGSFELDFGKVWFVRIGVVMLLTGLVFLGNYAYQNWVREMPNGLRLTALFACAGALLEIGRRLAAKENLSRFGEVLLAGGMAFFYYCTFAAHHVGRLKVIDSPVFAAVLLFLAAGAIAAVSWLRQAKATVILGILLASYSTMLQPIGWMSCVSNILLGALGLFFMLKPGWSGPGWVSMLGSYGAFFGWQLLGAAGHHSGTEDPAALWFLPPLWIMFSIPGVLGNFRESLSERARAWFTAVNNVLFFLLFSGIWISQNGDENYWQVAAVFGPILIGLGILGRRQDTTAGGVNLSQGLAVATFALVLKLDGHHLALTLAFESLALALASWKFRGRSESVVGLVAGMIAAALALVNFSVPVWSSALLAGLLAAASIVTVRVRMESEAFARFVRNSSALLLIAAAAVTTQLCFLRLGETASLLTSVALCGLLSLASLKLDRKRLQPEVIWISLWFLTLACYLASSVNGDGALVIAAAVALTGCWLWHRQPEPEEEQRSSVDLAEIPYLPAWAFSVAVPFFVWLVLRDGEHAFLHSQIAAVALLSVAIALRGKRLAITSGVLGFLNLLLLDHPGVALTWHVFGAVVLALGAVGTLYNPWAAKRIPEADRRIATTVFRLTAFVAYCCAWYKVSPLSWPDWIALTSLALTVASVLSKRKILEECLGLLAVALVAFFFHTTSSPWSLAPEQTSWRGFGLVFGMISIVMTYRQRPALIADAAQRDNAIRLLAGLACFVTAVWATQMLVWRFGWKPAAVLWTILGFAYVSAGLWQRLHILRVCGFILLVLSLAKLFVSDVWDFTAFMRVVSFIVLGAALIFLGLFYNKFAPAIKALLDDEKAGGYEEP